MKNWKGEEEKVCGLMVALPWQLRPATGGKGVRPTDIYEYSKYPTSKPRSEIDITRISAKMFPLRHLCSLEFLGWSQARVINPIRLVA